MVSVLNELPMPLIDIAAISQPCSCFANNIGLPFYSYNYYTSNSNNDRLGIGLVSSFYWKTYFPAHKKLSKHYNNLARMKLRCEKLTVKSMVAATVAKVPGSSSSSSRSGSITVSRGGLESHQNNVYTMVDIDSVMSSNNTEEEDSSEQVDEREKLRRMRISKANKGKNPWNKGRKHSEETLRKIKERTRLAMQDPKVKRKLVKLGHGQSDETKAKIGVGVRLGWERRREKLLLQETCLYNWQNLVANAARTGVCEEDELQWDSFKVLDEQLEKEWLESVEQRKLASRPKGSKRAPKSAEQRRKISAAIAAKWADPGYRVRVCSALAKFHGVSETAVRKPRKKPTGDGQTRKSPKLKGEAEDSAKHGSSSIKKIKLKRSKPPVYKDPLASSKLEMLKNIRAQRVATINKKTDTITRAKLLIAEAERAAEALEIAAQTSSFAQMSLMESRMLISEAIQFIESVKEDAVSFESDDVPADFKTIAESDDWKDEINMEIVNHPKVNGVHSLSANGKNEQDFDFNKFVLSNLMEDNAPDDPDEEPQERSLNAVHELEDQCTEATSDNYLSPELNISKQQSNCRMSLSDPKLNHNGVGVQFQPPLENVLKVNGEHSPRKANVIKKWVRGRLVEVEEET